MKLKQTQRATRSQTTTIQRGRSGLLTPMLVTGLAHIHAPAASLLPVVEQPPPAVAASKPPPADASPHALLLGNDKCRSGGADPARAICKRLDTKYTWRALQIPMSHGLMHPLVHKKPLPVHLQSAILGS